MIKRVSITRPERTTALMDRVASRRQRSLPIARAVYRDVGEEGRTNLRKQLRKGAQARAERDSHFAEEWFVLGDSVQPHAR